MAKLNRNHLIAISVLVGIVLGIVPPFSLVGALAVAHLSSWIHPYVFIAFAFAINFCIYFSASIWLLTKRFPETSIPAFMTGKPEKGIIYTEYEIKDFKKRGLL